MNQAIQQEINNQIFVSTIEPIQSIPIDKDSFQSGLVLDIKNQESHKHQKSKKFSEWQNQVHSAKIAWDSITEEELLSCGGNLDDLSFLVHKYYAISYFQAVKQVSVFLKKKFS